MPVPTRGDLRLIEEHSRWTRLLITCAVAGLISLTGGKLHAQASPSDIANVRLEEVLNLSSEADTVPWLVRMLDHPDPNVRMAVLGQLAARGPAAAEARDKLIRIASTDTECPIEVFSTLADIGDDGSAVAATLAQRFDDDPREAWEIAALATTFGPSVRQQLLPVLYRELQSPDAMLRAAAAMHLSKLESDFDRLSAASIEGIQYTLDSPGFNPYEPNYNVSTIVFLAEVLQDQAVHLSRQQLDRAIALLSEVRARMLKDHDFLEENEDFQATTKIQRALDRVQAERGLRTDTRFFRTALRAGALGLLVHALFWISLIAAYPKSTKVQAWFFWSPRVRAVAGFGYVGFVLTSSAYLRRKLFIPFQETLLGDLFNDDQEAHQYQFGTTVKVVSGDGLSLPVPIEDAIPEIRGHSILEGHSGLGKTMFLRWLVAKATRPTVYLTADRCSDGVLAAIQRKLQGPASDEAFLRRLLHAGALDICIDGLNEVSAETRVRIREFLEGSPKANVIVATQPIDWGTQRRSRTHVEVLPLASEKIASFLRGFGENLLPSDELPGYYLACERYLLQVLAVDAHPAVRQAMLRVLSNPMDLSVVAELLSRQIEPNLWELQQQQFQVVSRHYEEVNQGNPFPLHAVSEVAYRMRLTSDPVLPVADFPEAVSLLETHRMTVRKDVRVSTGSSPRFQFRHDKIADFFIAQLFGGVENELTQRHLADVRFLGVYLFLALKLPIDEVERIEQRLGVTAADTGDHSLSDPFAHMAEFRRKFAQTMFVSRAEVISSATASGA